MQKLIMFIGTQNKWELALGHNSNCLFLPLF
jgi:hypothetical protein